MGGGGSKGGGGGGGDPGYGAMAGAVVQAAQIEAMSADKAMQIAQEQFNASLAFVTQQYNTARSDVMPYISNGYAASEEMKFMLGLGEAKDFLPANAPDELQRALNTHSVDFGRFQQNSTPYVGLGQVPGVTGFAQNGYNAMMADETSMRALQAKMLGSPQEAPNGYGMYANSKPEAYNFMQQIMAGMGYGNYSSMYSSAMSNARTGSSWDYPGSFGPITSPEAAAYQQAMIQIQQYAEAITAQTFGDWRGSPAPAVPGLSLDMLSKDERFMDQWKAYGLPTQRKFVEGNVDPQKIISKLQQTPGYQFNLQQGLQSVENSQAAKGSLDSGQTLKGITQYGQGMAESTFNNRMNQLTNLAQLGQASATFTASQAMQQGENVANMRQQLGDTLGSGEMAKGSILANGLIGSTRWNILANEANRQKDEGGGGGAGMAQGGKARKGKKKVMGETTNMIRGI